MAEAVEERNQNGGLPEGEQPFECVPGANLYIKNLDDNIDDDWLRRTFGSYGPITSAKVMRHDGGASKGFGFVCFSTAEEAAVAKNDLNGKLLPDCSKPLYVNVAQKKEERRAFLLEQYALPFQAWRGGAPATQPDRWVQNGRPAQVATPPCTRSSPHQVPSAILPLSAKPNHHMSNQRAPLSVAAPAMPLAGVPPQQVGGMNGFVMVGPPIRQPLAAAAAPRPNFYLNPAASTVPQPAVQRIQYTQVGAPWQYPVNSRQAGQTYAVHPTHVHVAAGTPAPAQYVVNPVGAKIPHLHVHQQNQGVNVMRVPIPYGVPQPAALQQVRPVASVGVAAYPGQSHHSVWANGLP